LYSIIK